MVKRVIIGPKWFDMGPNYTKYENCQNSQKQSWANNQIFKYIPIFWTNIFIRENICWFFLDWIILDFHWWSFYHAKYILIFIRPISMVRELSSFIRVTKSQKGVSSPPSIFLRKMFNLKYTHIQVRGKHQNCHFWELKEELKWTEKNLKELNLSK